MRTITLFLAGLLLSSCASTPSATQACLANPPSASDTFMVGMCQTLLELPERDRLQAREWDRLGQLQAPRRAASVRTVPTIAQLDADIDQLERYAMPTPLLPPAQDWLLYQTPHGTYTNYGHGFITGPDGLYVAY